MMSFEEFKSKVIQFRKYAEPSFTTEDDLKDKEWMDEFHKKTSLLCEKLEKMEPGDFFQESTALSTLNKEISVIYTSAKSQIEMANRIENSETRKKELHRIQTEITDGMSFANQKYDSEIAKIKQKALEFEEFEIQQEKKDEGFETYIHVLNDEAITELYFLYISNRKECINKLIYNYMCDLEPYQPYLSKDLKFIENLGVSQNVKYAIIMAIEIWNKDDEEQLQFRKRSYLYALDINIDELLQIQRFYCIPPFPLVSTDRDQLFEDKIQRIIHLQNCNTQKCFFGNKKLYQDVINRKKKGDIKVIFMESGEDKFSMQYYLHSHILEEYESCNDEEIIINVTSLNVKVIARFIEALYTGSFDYENCSNDEITILCHIFKERKYEALEQLCEAILSPAEN